MYEYVRALALRPSIRKLYQNVEPSVARPLHRLWWMLMMMNILFSGFVFSTDNIESESSDTIQYILMDLILYASHQVKSGISTGLGCFCSCLWNSQNSAFTCLLFKRYLMLCYFGLSAIPNRVPAILWPHYASLIWPIRRISAFETLNHRRCSSTSKYIR